MTVPDAANDGARRLSVARLTLTDFRGYAHARMECDPRTVVLTGPNGAGKTNLLEAVSFLVPGRGLRGVRLDEAARHGGPGGWAVAASARARDGLVEIGTGLAPAQGERRQVRVDGEAMRGQSALADHLTAQWLTPQMDRLFLDGAFARRRFLDRLVFGFDPAHAGRVSGYERAMRERSRLLAQGSADKTWLSALEGSMAERGVAVSAARIDMANRLGAVLAQDLGPFPGARLEAAGEVEGWLAQGPALDAEDRLRAALEASRPRDAETGGAKVGPHRGDMAVRHQAKDVPAAQCSTGEQKALLIAITLANARLLAAERGAVPLLLLDEVAAHLDETRRAALFDEIEALGAQAWMTGTDAALFAPLDGRAQFFDVDDGRVNPRNPS